MTIEVRGLRKAFTGNEVLDGVELARQEGFPGVERFRSVMERVR